jgi:hypothetical protein
MISTIFKIVFWIGLLLVSGNAISQTIILKQTVPDELGDEDGNFGPNMKKFSHPYFGFGFEIGNVSHLDELIQPVKSMSSFSIYSGNRMYRNFNKIMAGVFDYEMSFSQSRLSWNEGDTTQLPVVKNDLEKAKYWFARVGGGLNLQLNFKPKRGNQLGNYIAFGGYGNYIFMKGFNAKYESNVSSFSDRTKVTLRKIKFTENWDYGLGARFGKTNFALFAKYRLSNLFKYQQNVWEFPELPRLVVGFQFFPGNI